MKMVAECKYKDVPSNSAMSEGCGGLTGKGVDESETLLRIRRLTQSEMG